VNFELSAKEFSSLVKCASAVISSRNIIPILEHALFSGDGETLSVSATCIEQTITSSTPCSAKGEFTASVSRLSAIAATLDKSQPVKIAFSGDGLSINPGTVTVSQGRSTHRLPSLRVDDYPRALMDPLENVTAEWEAPAPVLAQSLRDLSTFTGDEKTQIYIAGIYFDPEASVLVSTNAHVLGKDAAEWCRSKRAGFTLPDQAVKAICDVLAGRDKVTITSNERAVVFAVDGARLRTSLIDAQYPAYQRLIPQKFQTVLRVNAEALKASLLRVCAVGTDSVGGSGIELAFGKDELRLEANGENGNQGVDYCPCELVKGSPLTIGMATKNLLPVLGTMDGVETLEISMINAGEPLMITPAGSDDFMRLVMPVDLSVVNKRAA
jgi:DNA polymerase-3 subunit beta